MPSSSKTRFDSSVKVRKISSKVTAQLVLSELSTVSLENRLSNIYLVRYFFLDSSESTSCAVTFDEILRTFTDESNLVLLLLGIFRSKLQSPKMPEFFSMGFLKHMRFVVIKYNFTFSANHWHFKNCFTII